MKVTLNWLKQYVDFNWSPAELSERLTMIGIEVEGVQKIGGEFEGIVVAQVITRDKHPNADKLSLCRVNDGTGERQIVCGAQNFQAGDKVPLILPGASLPPKPGDKEPFTIKVGKIRGVESHGMLCSPQELGLPDQVDGLLILSPDARVGQPFAEYLGRAGNDVVYDLEITPNRPDLNSVIGIAREISAVTGNPLKIPNPGNLPASGAKTAELIAVKIEDAELCPRYAARIIRGVKVGPSPDWLKQTLEKVGIRSISNVVDVTNYVMLEIGQPLHAFDYHLVTAANGQRPTIVVRRASEGEKFTTLDGQQRTLTNQALLIADETKGIALAGIMGGQNSEITSNTKDVLIESAYFKPQNIRATSKKLELRTDSSYRFERGGDVGICDWASRRAVQLILETAGGELAEGVVDVYPQPAEPKTISLRPEKTSQLVGIEIPADRQIKSLQSLGLELTNAGSSTPAFRIPTFRVDLKREVDLIEEVARLFGIENIPSTPPRGAIGANAFDSVHDQLAEARRILTGLGLSEAQGQTLISSASAKLTGESVALQNPLSNDMDALRPSLIPGLLDALRHNLNRKNHDVALFEIGRVFAPNNGQVREERRVAIILTGQRQVPFWSGEDRAAKFDTYDLKGVLEEFLEQFGLRGYTFARREQSTTLLLESGTIQLGKNSLGELGQLLPALARRYDLRDAVLIAELNLDLLLARRNPSRMLKPLPQFPTIRRDVAMLVPEATTHEAVLGAVKQVKPANLENVELFDIFRRQNVPTGQKSLAYAFTYRNAERTLTDNEVNAAHEKLVEAFKRTLNATLRES
ncbi:MAG TPA: phenylalanine--tRNA ligase subunit beta [Verrucomicrobiae bacterium]|jgi:phenylalanyl-tRNA synthetase beta chain|nr:phenylalanine--tRNA ligase subunit beta [Verrucomicrobiae bacterium]